MLPSPLGTPPWPPALALWAPSSTSAFLEGKGSSFCDVPFQLWSGILWTAKARTTIKSVPWLGTKCSLSTRSPGITISRSLSGGDFGAREPQPRHLFQEGLDIGFLCNGVLSGLVAVTASCRLAAVGRTRPQHERAGVREERLATFVQPGS